MTEPGRRKSVRFTVVDLGITVLLMALAVVATWKIISTVQTSLHAEQEWICCFTATDLPSTADGKIRKGEQLYLEDGTPLGTVKSVLYQRPDGKTLQLTVYLSVTAQKEYGGYRAGKILLSVGERYHLQNKSYGGRLLCEKIGKSQEQGGK